MNILKSFFAGLVIAIAAPVLDATIINFDDLISDQVIPNGYFGLNWTNAYVYDAADDPDHLGHNHNPPLADGYDVAFVSSPNVAFNGGNNGSNPITISSNAIFNLNSAYLTSVWNDNLQVEVIGYVLGTPIYDQKFYPSATAHTLETFNYIGVDSVEFIPSGGTQHPGYTAFMGTYFAIDDLNIDLVQLTEVPEPGTWVAAALLLAFIAFSQRDRLCRAKLIGR
jgi:hypothetical protein